MVIREQDFVCATTYKERGAKALKLIKNGQRDTLKPLGNKEKFAFVDTISDRVCFSLVAAIFVRHRCKSSGLGEGTAQFVSPPPFPPARNVASGR